VALAPVAVGFKTIAATQRGEQAPAPLIGERELRLYRLFRLRRNSKGFPDPIDRSRRSMAFSDGRGAFEQRGDFAQLLAEFLFSGHRNC
jgi:hypothetical protein